MSVPRPSVDSGVEQVLASAARLQEVVPDAVLVRGSVAGLSAHHRLSYDHDHVVADLISRYDMVLEAMEETDGWILSQRHSRRPVTIMGSLDGVEAGLRQLRRSRPLETEQLPLPGGGVVRVPTYEEIIRVKGWLVLQRRAVRDYLDVAACTDITSAEVLRRLDHFYDAGEDGTVLVLLAEALANPAPRDPRVIAELPSYKGLAKRWHDWGNVVAVCQEIAREMM